MHTSKKMNRAVDTGEAEKSMLRINRFENCHSMSLKTVVFASELAKQSETSRYYSTMRRQFTNFRAPAADPLSWPAMCTRFRGGTMGLVPAIQLDNGSLQSTMKYRC